MNCPKCNKPGTEELFDEVDIGVGVIKGIYGADCPDCGQLSLCPHCGAWDFEPHAAWCADSRGN